MPLLIDNKKSFDDFVKKPQLSVVHFAADWVEQCKQIDDVIDILAKQDEYNEVNFIKCLAEDVEDISMKYEIVAAPTVLLFISGNVVERVEGADPVKLMEKIKHYSQNTYENTDNVEKSYNNVHESEKSYSNLNEKLLDLINRSRVMLFMKGDRETPKCGFSRQIIQILNSTGISYETFDILTDEEVRQGLKVHSDWPTYPQLYVKGELVGGLDIVKEMESSGELIITLKG